MPIIHAISFDDATNDASGYSTYGFTDITSSGNMPRMAGRYSGYAFGAQNVGTIDRSAELPALSESLEWTIGFDFYYEAQTETDPRGFLDLLDHSSARMCRVALTAAGNIAFYRGNGATLIATSATALAASTWYHLELQFRLNDTTGLFELKIDGSSDVAVSGVDTLEAGVGLPSYFLWGSFGSATAHRQKRFDNVIIQDELNWLGQIYAEPLTLSADTADKDFTRSTGSDNYALIDETVFDNTDYIESNVVGALDLYTLSNLSNEPAAIEFVQTIIMQRIHPVGVRQFRSVLKRSSSLSNGETLAYADGQTTTAFFTRHFTDPTTGVAWDKAGIDAMTAGIEVTA